MIIVSDATPIISFLKIGKLEILNKLYGEVLLPEAVYKEVTTNKEFFQEARQIINCNYIKKVKTNSPEEISLLRKYTGLDLGESEAIIYSEQNKADLLIVDEIKARQVAISMNIKITGTIGVLFVANQEGLLSKEEVYTCVKILKSNHRYISESLYNNLLKSLI